MEGCPPQVMNLSFNGIKMCKDIHHMFVHIGFVYGNLMNQESLWICSNCYGYVDLGSQNTVVKGGSVIFNPDVLMYIHVWYVWYISFSYHTVDGSEIRRSPVEVGGFSHYLQGFLHTRCRISAINSITSMAIPFEPHLSPKSYFQHLPGTRSCRSCTSPFEHVWVGIEKDTKTSLILVLLDYTSISLHVNSWRILWITGHELQTDST